jgi:hypothetical protein
MPEQKLMIDGDGNENSTDHADVGQERFSKDGKFVRNRFSDSGDAGARRASSRRSRAMP